MIRKFAIATIATLICATTAYSADDTQKPSSAGTDTSTGAKEQSSAPAGSAADKDMSKDTSAGTSSDKSTGAKEQSSAPPGSSAADPSKPNPTLGTDKN
jgi:hypothetical protein